MKSQIQIQNYTPHSSLLNVSSQSSPIIDQYNPIFHILGLPTIIIKRKIQKLNLIANIEQANNYDVLDINGNVIGSLVEESSGIGAIVLRQFTNNNRSFTIKLYDNNGTLLLILKRSYTVFKSTIKVILPNGKEVGKSVQSLNVIKRKYSLYTNSSTPFGEINASPLSWKFPILNNEKLLIGYVNRSFNELLRQLFLDVTLYVIKMDYQSYASCSDNAMDYNGLTLNQRAVVLGLVISIDFDYFSQDQ